MRPDRRWGWRFSGGYLPPIRLLEQFPTQINMEYISGNSEFLAPTNFQVENEMSSVRERYGEAFWRAYHKAWVQGELHQREYCEACGIPLKAFGNWRAKFKAEPQVPARKVLYRRGGLSHALSHGLSSSDVQHGRRNGSASLAGAYWSWRHGAYEQTRTRSAYLAVMLGQTPEHCLWE